MDEPSRPYRTTLSWREKISVLLLKYGYANHVPFAWAFSGLILKIPDPDPAEPGLIWDAAGPRAQARLTKDGWPREIY